MSAAHTARLALISFMLINKPTIFAAILIFFSLIIDTMISTGKYPLLTLITCAIVVILSYVAPHIRNPY